MLSDAEGLFRHVAEARALVTAGTKRKGGGEMICI